MTRGSTLSRISRMNYVYPKISPTRTECTIGLVLARGFATKRTMCIVRTFDFLTKLFGQLEGPPIPGDHWASLMLQGGSLATMSSDDVTQEMTACYDIWVRIDENNWINVCTVNPPIQEHWSIGIWECDKFIYELTHSYMLVIYDQTTKEITSPGFQSMERSACSNWAMSYKESLVLIKREKPSDKQYDTSCEDDIVNVEIEIFEIVH
ncbi:hypothetical protein HAX54_004667, partial [Datura stramonium]|nr:hypothetical protein [Datura stramonium]